MAFSHTIGGTTFTESNFDGTAYADETDGFPAALEKVVEHVANAFRGTATDSVTIGTGSKSFTITNANTQIPAFAVGMPVRIAETASPATNYMQGTVTAWDGATGAMTASVDAVGGSGTISAWTITVGGNISTAPATPVTVANGGTGATSASVARTNLGVEIGTDVLAPTGDGSALTGISSTQPNLIINGGMTVSQRGTSFATLSASAYTLDRWYYQAGGSTAAVTTVSQETAGGVDGASHWMKLLTTTADASLDTNDAAFVEHRIEGLNAGHLLTNSGKMGATTIGADIIVHADGASSLTFPATFAMALMDADGTRVHVEDVTITAADTWQRVSFSTAADATAYFTVDNTYGLRLLFTLAAGSDRNGTSGTWQSNASNYYNTSSSDNFVDAANNYVGITNVKLEVGSSATSFEHESYGDTVRKCERYYQQHLDTGVTPATNTANEIEYYASGHTSNAHTIGIPVFFGTRMRAAPTIVLYDAVGTINQVTVSSGHVAGAVNYSNEKGFRAGGTSTAATTRHIQFYYTAASEL